MNFTDWIIRKIYNWSNHLPIVTFARAIICHRRYLTIIERIKAKRQINPDYKLRVAFLVSEAAKWCVQPLWEALCKDENFEPFILVTLADIQIFKSDTEKEKILQDNYLFFSEKVSPKTYKVYDTQKKVFLSLNRYNPDIVVYQHPWIIDYSQNISKVSRFALTVYFPYGFQPLENPYNYLHNWHIWLWKYFLDLPENIERIEKYHLDRGLEFLRNYLFLGYPKMDCGIPDRSDLEHFTILYAPHWSIGEFSTFEWSSREIMDFAETTQQINWIFKPHPTLRHGLLVNKIMTEDEIDKYFDFWENHADVWKSGSYFETFSKSNMMITDSISFLGEYLITGKPVIHLRRHDQELPFNKAGNNIVENYYAVYDCEMLKKALKTVLLEKNDYKCEKRQQAAEKFRLVHKGSSERIINYLKRNIL